eukprot:6227586-Pyramimonas_sp.AAC.1
MLGTGTVAVLSAALVSPPANSHTEDVRTQCESADTRTQDVRTEVVWTSGLASHVSHTNAELSH